MKHRVAVCQYSMEWCNIPSNLLRAEEFIARAKADTVILPEMFATGFTTDPTTVAQPMSGEIVEWMRSVATKYGCAVVGTAIISEEGKCYNRALFVKPSGEVLHSDKRHLFTIGGEAEHLTAGSERVVVEWGGLRWLLLVCYDLRFPVWSRCRGDYDVALYPASWPASRRRAWQTLLQARAIENEAFVIGANRTGSDPTTNYSGESAIIGFKGEILAEIGAEEGVISAELDAEELAQFREKFPTLNDADHFRIENP
ncbi:MAG: nitrilase family protein [Rikenellaceae bacterium]|nr:nitrilase family protein [Rikenellaceae bacterium]